jgi:hypothetical protein
MEGDDQATQDTAAATATAAPSPSDDSNAAAKTGTTAPPANAARDAFDRLTRGERPEDVNKAVYQQKPAAAAQPAADRATPQKTEATKGEPQPGQAWPEGTAPKDAQVLQRAKMDPEAWKHIPPSNRAKILAGLRNSQAEADRQFQAARATAKAGGKAADTTQTNAEPNDPAAPGEPEDDATEQLEDGQQPAQQQARQQPAQQQQQPPQQFLAPKDRETLQLLGGDDLAETMERSLGNVHQHYQQQMAPLVGVLEYLLDQHVGAQFDSAVNELAKTPGMESLKDGDKATANQQALRDKAMLLHRAAGDPRSYPFSEAVKDAAASLFKTNLHQATQALLLKQRTASLNGAPDKGDGTRNTPRALDAKERSRAIFSHLQQGMNPDDARRAVDGA